MSPANPCAGEARPVRRCYRADFSRLANGLMTRVSLSLAAACVLLPLAANAASITLIPTADATLIENVADNSMGGAEYVLAGTTQNGPRNRAVLKFDISGELPAGAKITGAALTITAIRQSREAPAGASFGVHRMLRSWGEGSNVPETQPGQGVPASAGDATWNNRFHPDMPWSSPGGSDGVDFVGQASSSVIIDTLGAFPLDNTFELIADVQYWLDHPAENFGWMLKCEDEQTRFTARQFAAREYSNPQSAPQLIIDYTPPPLLAITRESANQVVLSGTAETAGSYSLEFRSALVTNSAWQTLTNFGSVPANSVLQATDSIAAAQRFYRLRQQ